MKNEIISIIIPIGPRTDNIEIMLKSVLMQNWTDYEVIGIYDSKPCEIFEDICKVDKRFRSIMGNGKGAGAARNIGLKIAKGKYIVFWDCDDFFCADLLQNVYNFMESGGVDIAIWNAYEFSNITGRLNLNTPHLRPELVEGEKLISPQEFEFIFNFTSAAVWNKMYRRSFLIGTDIKFMEQPRFNDISFVQSTLVLAKKVGTFNRYEMYYRMNNDNSLQGSREVGIEDAWKAFEQVYSFLTERKMYKDNLRKSFLNYVLSCSIALYRECESTIVQEKILYYLRNNKILIEMRPEDAFSFHTKEYELLVDIWNYKKSEFVSKFKENGDARIEYIIPTDYFELLCAKQNLEQIKRSKSYKIGRIITELPRMIREIYWRK